MRKRLVFSSIACLLLIPLILAACAAEEEEANVVTIGVIGPMQYVEGEHHWYGAEMARDEINEAGGITVGDDEYLIELIKADSNEMLSPTDAAAAMERLITVDKADFVVGGFRSEAVFAMQDVAMDYQKIFLGCGASHPQLTAKVAEDYDRYKYWFRVTPLNSYDLGKLFFPITGIVADAIRKEVGIETPKVAIMAEKAVWCDPIVAAAHTYLPAMGMEIVGEWRPSPTATDVTAELSAIKASGAQIIFTAISGPVGIPYAKQLGELEIPVASVACNVEAQKRDFWDATEGYGNYETFANTYARVQVTEKTIPFYDKFVERSGEFPTYNAGTYDAIYILKDAIERAGTLDSDAVVVELEKTDYHGVVGRSVFYGEGNPYPHDPTFGPGYVTGLGTQWQDGELKCVWPPADGSWQGVIYKGAVPYKLPPRVTEYWKK